MIRLLKRIFDLDKWIPMDGVENRMRVPYKKIIEKGGKERIAYKIQRKYINVHTGKTEWRTMFKEVL